MFGLSKAFLAAFAACVFLFVAFPEIDLGVSSLFFSQEEGVFVLRENRLALLMYHAVTWASRFLPVLLLVGLGVTSFTKKRPFDFEPKAFLYLLLVFVVGVILLVNAVFKDHWGRARPYQIEEFGGPMKFTPAFVISDQKESNSSWPCGHASFGFYFVAVAMVLKKHRALAMALAGVLGALIGLARMAQGKHFGGDVVSAFLLVYITERVLYYFMYESKCGSVWRWGGAS